MSAAYTSLPTQANGTSDYPPTRTKALLSRLTPAAPPTRIRRLLLFIAVLALSSLFILYLAFSSSLPSSSIFPVAQETLNDHNFGYMPPGDPTSPWFRDSHPVLHTRLFLARAQAEIRARKLDTCNGQLSTPMVDGYVDAAQLYCSPNHSSPAPASITCFPARGPGSPNEWWPYPQSFCASRNLGHTLSWGGSPEHGQFTGACSLTGAGEQLKADMGREGFVGKDFNEADNGVKDGKRDCGEIITHPVLFVPRQDRWNPFHVGEDLVTTFLALTIFSRHGAAPISSLSSFFQGGSKLWTSLPEAYSAYAAGSTSEFLKARKQLAEEVKSTAGLQLMFLDEYLPTVSLFAPLYDRMGAFPPRRTAAEALGDGGPTCFSSVFHSVGAGASLLSGTGVGKEWGCASELVWGASLWLRWLWGMEALPGGELDLEEDLFRRDAMAKRAPVGQLQDHRPPVQVLFLSREKFDALTKHQNKKLSSWQESRHITNEHELVDGLRKGLEGLCRIVTDVGRGTPSSHTPGSYDCTYTDTDVLPGAWGVDLHPREARALGLSRTPTAPSPEVAPRQEEVTSENHVDTVPPRALRFSTLDPTTAALPAQLGAVGRADVVVSVHAGALGLMLFMPTGHASVVELVPSGAHGNYHFHNMAAMLGMQYEKVDVGRQVNVQKVVQAVQRVVGGHLER
ncbi:hypothetical protein FB45DRAFT_928140 [Roridomyces roridus]|uniref:Uncharacterized protein n=1 Tax=Roridomyces roridus TaxID=1738132 RepID=A0AAD7BH23_9AGAR|nr:hypothetical protein FB45DRAFT_928140 [Roridomyces roridus]